MLEPDLDQRLGALRRPFQAGDKAAFAELYRLCVRGRRG